MNAEIVVKITENKVLLSCICSESKPISHSGSWLFTPASLFCLLSICQTPVCVTSVQPPLPSVFHQHIPLHWVPTYTVVKRGSAALLIQIGDTGRQRERRSKGKWEDGRREIKRGRLERLLGADKG